MEGELKGRGDDEGERRTRGFIVCGEDVELRKCCRSKKNEEGKRKLRSLKVE